MCSRRSALVHSVNYQITERHQIKLAKSILVRQQQRSAVWLIKTPWMPRHAHTKLHKLTSAPTGSLVGLDWAWMYVCSLVNQTQLQGWMDSRIIWYSEHSRIKFINATCVHKNQLANFVKKVLKMWICTKVLVNEVTMCTYTVFRKKHPLTFSSISPWVMCRFKQKL